MFGVILYIMISLIAVMIAGKVKNTAGSAYPAASRQDYVNVISLTALFLVLFIPSALRIHTGNDYFTYIIRFHDAYTGNHIVTEPGFNLIIKAVYSFLGKEIFLLIFAIFAFLTVLAFIRGMYLLSEDFAMTVFLFMTLGLYFQTYNTVRYYLALGILLISMYHAVKGNHLKFIILVLLASLFHKTAVCVLLFYPFCRLKWNKVLIAILGLGGISGLIFKEQYLALFLRVYPSYVNEEEYLNSGSISWVNILRCLAVLALCIYFYRPVIKENEQLLFYMKLNTLALIFYGCFSFVPFASRIGYYLNISQILLIPGIIKGLDEKKKKYLTIMVAAAGIVYFAFFLYKAFGDVVRVLPYSTWLDYSGSMDGLTYVKVTG